jgi:hypothetical protein
MAMAAPTAPAKSQFVMTPKARLSFANLFRPRVSRFDATKSNYSCVLVFEPGTDLTALKSLVWRAAVEAFGESRARDTSATQYPFKALRADDPKIPGFPDGSVAINCQSQFPPGLCDQSRQPVIDPNTIYSGCYVHATVNAFAWERAGKRGVSFGLGNMQKIADGPRLDNRRTIEQDFQPLPGAAAGPVGGGSDTGIPF